LEIDCFGALRPSLADRRHVSGQHLSGYGRAHIEVGGAADKLGSNGIEVQPVPALEGMLAVTMVFQMMAVALADREPGLPRSTVLLSDLPGADEFERGAHLPIRVAPGEFGGQGP
jgi:hypothetical protein